MRGNGVAAGFDVQPQHGFGVRGPQVEPPPANDRPRPSVVSMPSACGSKAARTRATAAPGSARVKLISPEDGNAACRAATRSASGWPAAPHQFGHHQPGDHAAVAGDEIAEIVMRRHFAAIDRAMVAHRLFEKGMSGARLHRLPAGPATISRVFQMMRGSWMMVAPGSRARKPAPAGPRHIRRR
jgi:hypothetical protein